MAKGKGKKDRSALSHPPKTKTPKGKRSGIWRAAHHNVPPVRLQTPWRKGSSFDGVTNMRAAFEDLPTDVLSTKLGRKILRLLRGRRGTFKTRGWRVLR